MSRLFSRLITFGCTAIIIAAPLAALYFLTDIAHFARWARSSLSLPIQWHTVSDTQWYCLWLLSTAYLAIGLAGLYFLRRAFANFAKGELFNQRNSQDLRRFAILLFAQGLAKPLHFSLASMLLSLNHTAGQKMLSVSVGSAEVKVIALAMMLWVISDLLVKASQLDNENKQFV